MQQTIENEEHHYVEPEPEPEPESDDAPDFAERWALKLRAFKRAPSISLLEAARRGVRWAVERMASRSMASAAGTGLTEGDKRFLTWFANAAVAFYLSENPNTAEG